MLDAQRFWNAKIGARGEIGGGGVEEVRGSSKCFKLELLQAEVGQLILTQSNPESFRGIAFLRSFSSQFKKTS